MNTVSRATAKSPSGRSRTVPARCGRRLGHSSGGGAALLSPVGYAFKVLWATALPSLLASCTAAGPDAALRPSLVEGKARLTRLLRDSSSFASSPAGTLKRVVEEEVYRLWCRSPTSDTECFLVDQLRVLEHGTPPQDTQAVWDVRNALTQHLFAVGEEPSMSFFSELSAQRGFPTLLLYHCRRAFPHAEAARDLEFGGSIADQDRADWEELKAETFLANMEFRARLGSFAEEPGQLDCLVADPVGKTVSRVNESVARRFLGALADSRVRPLHEGTFLHPVDEKDAAVASPPPLGILPFCPYASVRNSVGKEVRLLFASWADLDVLTGERRLNSAAAAGLPIVEVRFGGRRRIFLAPRGSGLAQALGETLHNGSERRIARWLRGAWGSFAWQLPSGERIWLPWSQIGSGFPEKDGH